MMGREDAWYDEQDALGLAAMVRAGEVSAAEVVEAAIARIEARNPTLNAVVATCFDDARTCLENGLPDGPLTGVPMLIKDLYIHVAGLPTTHGSRLFADAVADRDSEHVARLRRAGCVILGKTNTPEFGTGPTTEPVLFGPTRNPWALDRSSGGSSGGSAAAVAGGMLPAAHATDGGGSIRIPASCCGLFGLKPTRGRTTVAPQAGEAAGGMSIQHAVTRTVRDSAALLDVTHGSASGDPYSAPRIDVPFSAAVTRDPPPLRIALITTMPDGTAVDRECVEAAQRAASLCEALGHQTDATEWPLRVDAMSEISPIIGPNLAATVEERLETLDRDLRDDDLEPIARNAIDRAGGLTATQYARALRRCHALGRTMAAFHETYDVLLTPTLGTLPRMLGVERSYSGREEYLAEMRRYIGMLPLFNATGQPAMSVPLYTSDEGLPIGIHFAARFGDESTLFQLAGQLERATPWGHRRAPAFRSAS
jgi:amidase